MKAIVYTSNTGSSKAYAEMLGAKIALPVYAWDDAVKTLDAGTGILYIGWLMAGAVVNLAKAQKKFTVCAVCAVGMTASKEMESSVRTRNKLPADMPLFLMQGAYDKTKLHGMYRFVMKIVGAALEKKIKESVQADRLTVIIAKAPCALLKGQKFTQVCVVREDKCRHCNMCMKIGCPAISKVDGEIKINASMCNGCGLCQSYCKFGAIERVER